MRGPLIRHFLLRAVVAGGLLVFFGAQASWSFSGGRTDTVDFAMGLYLFAFAPAVGLLLIYMIVGTVNQERLGAALGEGWQGRPLAWVVHRPDGARGVLALRGSVLRFVPVRGVPVVRIVLGYILINAVCGFPVILAYPMMLRGLLRKLLKTGTPITHDLADCTAIEPQGATHRARWAFLGEQGLAVFMADGGRFDFAAVRPAELRQRLLAARPAGSGSRGT